MESMPHTPDEAAVALAAAEASRAQLVGHLELPSGFFPSIGAAIAVQIASAAIGISSQSTRGLLLLVAGGVVFALAAVLQIARFRRLNGVWLAGIASRVVLGTATAASTVYVAAMAAAVWSAFAEAWWFVAVASLLGGAGYALSGHRWLGIYRSDPEAHGRPESTALLALVVLVALAGLVALVIER